MVATYLSLESLAPALEKNAPILVPNNRLRNHLLRAFALEQDTNAWIKPNIHSLSQWLDEQWNRLQQKGFDYACVAIASPLQRQITWESAIKNSTLGATLLQPKPLAQQADSALKNLELWQLKNTFLTDTFIDPKSNSAQFLGWMNEFNRSLQLQQCITREASYLIITHAFIKGDLQKHASIYLEGFDDLPPLIQTVLEAASTQLIKLPNQIAQTTELLRTQAQGTEDEIRAAALWSKTQLTQSPNTALIGIVVPNLGQCRDQVERVFTEVFEAHSLIPNTPRYTLPFNFSAGTPLGATPLIHSLFQILHLQEKQWPLEDICNFLHSPFWGDEGKESQVRTHLIEELRKLERMNLSISDLRYHATKIEEKIAVFSEHGLSPRFEVVENLLRRKFEHKTATEWLMFFDEILRQMNWPGTRRLDSQEYQQLMQWQKVRDEFSSMDSHITPMSYIQACNYLRELADKTPFQAQTPDSPIQILGALEAAGLQFSHLWVMGLSDNLWPPAPIPNPLLPLHLQRENNMPHASAARELEIAQGLTLRYKKSAPIVIFSSAHSDGGNEQRASALIHDIPLTELDILLNENKSALQQHYQLLQDTKKLTIITDANGPTLEKNEPVRGGSHLFKYQAACPFEAFARLRLGAKNPSEPCLGFTAADRGNLLHDSLAAIWRELKDSVGLNAHDPASLHNLVSQITEQTITQIQARNPRELGKVYCKIEQRRLTQLLCEWLDSERDRPAFKVIAIEQDNDIGFAGLKLKLRIDRLDEFNNGDRLLIDYKTGTTNAKAWQGERITEPQLPLYAITREDIAAISFAQINRKQKKWDGLGELHDTSLSQPGIKAAESWPAQLEEWQQQLQQLANDFIAGDARVDFKDKKSQSYAIDLAPLTRLADADALINFSKI